MAPKLLGFTNLQTGQFFSVEEEPPFACKFMEKNPDQFARKYALPQGSDAPSEERKNTGPTYTREDLDSLLLKDLKGMCKDRGISTGDSLKEGVIDLILADQDARE